MKRILIAVATLGLLWTPRGMRADSTHVADVNPASNYVGVWLLDREASEPIGPLLKLMEVPWFVRKMAAVVTPTLTISTPGDGRLRMINQNTIRSTDRAIVADGSERETEDALGRKVIESATWNELGQLVVTQKNHIEADRVVEVTSTWARVGQTLELTLSADSEVRPLSIRRVFRPKP